MMGRDSVTSWKNLVLGPRIFRKAPGHDIVGNGKVHENRNSSVNKAELLNEIKNAVMT